MKIRILKHDAALTSRSADSGTVLTAPFIKQVAVALGRLNPKIKGLNFRAVPRVPGSFHLKTERTGPTFYLSEEGNSVQLSAYYDYITTASLAIVKAKDVSSLIGKFTKQYNASLEDHAREPKKTIARLEKYLLKT